MNEVRFDLFILKLAPYMEHLCNCDLFLQATDGKFYRPAEGWPLITEPE